MKSKCHILDLNLRLNKISIVSVTQPVFLLWTRAAIFKRRLT